MTFILIGIGSLVILGLLAAMTSIGDNDDAVVKAEGDCASCTGRDDCKIIAIMAEKEKRHCQATEDSKEIQPRRQ